MLRVVVLNKFLHGLYTAPPDVPEVLLQRRLDQEFQGPILLYQHLCHQTEHFTLLVVDLERQTGPAETTDRTDGTDGTDGAVTTEDGPRVKDTMIKLRVTEPNMDRITDMLALISKIFVKYLPKQSSFLNLIISYFLKTLKSR